MVKRPWGWRKEPARHALAAKGVETARRKSGPQRTTQPLSVLRSRPAGISPQVKDQAIDEILQSALDETGGDKGEAASFIRDEGWLNRQIKSVAKERVPASQVNALEKDLKAAFADKTEEVSR